MASTKVTVAHLRVYNYLNSSDNLKDAVLPQRLQFTIPYFLTANLDGCDSQSNGYPGDCDPGDRTLNPAGDRPRERPSTHSQCDSVLPQRFPRDQTFGVGHHCESSGHFSNEPVAKVDTSSLVKTQLLAELKTQLDIDLSGVKFPILKLKNHRGSLVPLSLHSFKLSLARQPLDLEILSRLVQWLCCFTFADDTSFCNIQSPLCRLRIITDGRTDTLRVFQRNSTKLRSNSKQSRITMLTFVLVPKVLRFI